MKISLRRERHDGRAAYTCCDDPRCASNILLRDGHGSSGAATRPDQFEVAGSLRGLVFTSRRTLALGRAPKTPDEVRPAPADAQLEPKGPRAATIPAVWRRQPGIGRQPRVRGRVDQRDQERSGHNGVRATFRRPVSVISLGGHDGSAVTCSEGVNVRARRHTGYGSERDGPTIRRRGLHRVRR